MEDSSYYGTPVIISAEGHEQVLKRRSFGGGGVDSYDEDWLQTLLMSHAQLLPVSQIDRAYERLVPVCRELMTPAGPLDVLYATPEGRLVIVEAKLWRNPEARRKVIGQILDYATEISRWTYEDLQREVSIAARRQSSATLDLFEIVRARYPDVSEPQFVDDVTRALASGHFLLLIVGDGIREGTAAIANFLDRGGNLHFGLGLIEMAIFDLPGGGRLVEPRVLAKTVELKRTILVTPNGRVVLDQHADADQEGQQVDETEDPKRKVCIDFWGVFLEQLELDDQSQPVPANGTGMANRFFPLPPTGKSWISAWIGPYGGNKAGVYITFSRDGEGDAAFDFLQRQQVAIDREIGLPTTWHSKSGKHFVSVERQFQDVLELAARPEIHAYLSDATNRFVNAFRHRLLSWDKSRAGTGFQ
jgi:hypothetical protein